MLFSGKVRRVPSSLANRMTSKCVVNFLKFELLVSGGALCIMFKNHVRS